MVVDIKMVLSDGTGRWFQGQIRQYSIVLSIFLWHCVKTASAFVCVIPSLNGGTRNKTCPDFKADPSFQYCCTSKLPPSNVVYKEKHGVYCCSLTDYEKEQDEIASAELRAFVKDYLLVIIISALASFCLVLLAISYFCRKIQRCPLYRDSTVLSNANPSSYRPVDTIPPKIYEAPPPYESFVPPPDQGRNDWNCVLENEVNRGRYLPPVTTWTSIRRPTNCIFKAYGFHSIRFKEAIYDEDQT